MFNTGRTEFADSAVNFSLQPNPGYCFGMVIRRGFTKNISLETGINYVKRNYTLQIQDTSFFTERKFAFIGYEIPVLGLVYIRLSRQLYMNASAGLSFDMFPSDLAIQNEFFNLRTLRRNWLQTSLLANIGYEWRTEKSGYFYLGASYHRPFQGNAYNSVLYKRYSARTGPVFNTWLSGNYLTIDLRYFFHEDPEKRKKKVKKKEE